MITLTAHLSILITSILICSLFIVHFRSRYLYALDCLDIAHIDNKKLMEEKIALERELMLMKSGQIIERKT